VHVFYALRVEGYDFYEKKGKKKILSKVLDSALLLGKTACFAD
jgi:hypothetical protein